MTRTILALTSHPAMQHSRATNALVSAIADLDFVTAHDLYQEYPDFFIDVKREQGLLVEHDIILFHHPVYWYSCPALMKEWIDVVLEYNFAYGAKGRKLAGKVWQSVVTTGGPAEAYRGGRDNNHSIDELFLPFRRTALLCSMNYQNPLVFHGISRSSDQQIAELAAQYRDYILRLVEQS